MMPDRTPTDVRNSVADSVDDSTRRRAVKQIERRRRFRIELLVSIVGMTLLLAIWAISEYHNAGGWPTHGFSQSSGVHDVWNYWIVYPVIGWVLIVSARWWTVRQHKPISDAEIEREMARINEKADRAA